MVSLRKSAGHSLGLMFVTALFANAQGFAPGTINGLEGKVALDGQTVLAENVGSAVMSAGQTLQTGQGVAEVLLTPGVYIRVGENSSLKMEAVSVSGMKVELISGEAVVEVDKVDKLQRLDMIDKGADARLDRSGIYRFNANQPAISVYSGKVRVEDDRRGIELASGQQLLLSGSLKAQKFDRTEIDPLYAWSQKRADYASQVSEWTGEELLGLDGQPQYKQGWYWSPWYKSWAFIPPKGYVRTPFGYGIYAPQESHSVTPVFGDFRK